MDDFCEALKQHKPWIEELLLRSGAILFRGFPLRSASDFNSILESFGYDELLYLGGSGPRTNVPGRVYTVNESPPHLNIPFHHEMAYARVFPSKLFFFCEEEPKTGGQTPIVLSHLVYQTIKQRFPDFVQRLEEHGLVYTRFLAAEFDPSSPVGRGWQLTFSTQDKTTAEERLLEGYPGKKKKQQLLKLLESPSFWYDPEEDRISLVSEQADPDGQMGDERFNRLESEMGSFKIEQTRQLMDMQDQMQNLFAALNARFDQLTGDRGKDREGSNSLFHPGGGFIYGEHSGVKAGGYLPKLVKLDFP